VPAFRCRRSQGAEGRRARITEGARPRGPAAGNEARGLESAVQAGFAYRRRRKLESRRVACKPAVVLVSTGGRGDAGRAGTGGAAAALLLPA